MPQSYWWEALPAERYWLEVGDRGFDIGRDLKAPAGDNNGKARALLTDAAERLALSARAYHRVLRVARIIADLAGEELVGAAAVAEALRWRPAVASTPSAGRLQPPGVARPA